MDKNNIIGFSLIAAVLIGFSIWNQPSAEERAEIARQDSIANVKKAQEKNLASKTSVANTATDSSLANADTTSVLFNALKGTAQDVTLKSEKLTLTLNSKGAVVRKVLIKGFKDRNGNPDVTLFNSNDQNLSYILSTKEENIDTKELYFQPSNVTDSTVTFTAQLQGAKKLVINYQLKHNYLLHTSIQAQGMNAMFAPNTNSMDVVWQDKCRQQEKGFTFENRYSTLTYHKADGGTDYLSESSEKVDEKIEDKLDWIAFKNQFFSAVMIAKDDFQSNALLTSIPQEKGSGYLKDYKAKLKTFFDPTGKKPTEFEFYYGPNDFRLLQNIEDNVSFTGKDLQMQRLVYLGWPLFRIINRWFTIYVFDFLTSMNMNMGIVLILITLLLKLLTYPLVKKSYMSSAKMRVLKPRLEEATKHLNGPDNQMQKQQAMMSEYAKYGVSPLSGCLPMLIQMPIWIAMFNFVPNAIQLRGESFLWISDLSTYDPILEWHNNYWLIGDHLSLTCILFCAANLLYSWMTMKQQKDQMIGQQAEQMKMMQYMMFIMPLMFFFMFNDYSAGLNFYYFMSLFFSALIMWILRKTTDDEKLLAILDKKYKENKDNPKKLSGLAARLQAMQQEQQEMLRKRNELQQKKNK
ncbi:MAG: membrane protein insertase YidC [Prevotella nanceiensis]|uniref:membrane protein insertase YidC n=1 Tax=Hoylesella nanceiensis TaxID=425941 RepID=UPI001CABF922|nr:membrane protein insertase YidC [Hoylesella nanceiensis]MBF1432924.1 membrane protein insertase YidC [Hoylesella nanceiensis]